MDKQAPNLMLLMEDCLRVLQAGAGNQLPGFLVRGSFVARHWMSPYQRPCHDLDLMLLGDWDVQAVQQRFMDLSQQLERWQVATDQIEFKPIWQDSPTPGLRVLLPCRAATQPQSPVLELQIDISAADPMVQAPQWSVLPTTGGQGLGMLVPGIETAAAWKLHGLFEHLNGAWMPKTLWDLYVLCRYNSLDQAQLYAAIDLAFSSRLDPLPIIKRLLFGDFGQSKRSQRQWPREVGELVMGPAPAMDTVLYWLRQYLQPVLELENDGELLSLEQVLRYRIAQLKQDNSLPAQQKLKQLQPKTKVMSGIYPSMPHLPGSRLGPSEKTLDANRVRMLLQQQYQPGDHVIVQEKLDGSCVGVLRRGDEILALGRAGDLAEYSVNQSRRLWADWVLEQQSRFRQLLGDGEYAVGEWLAMAHGTRYRLNHEPFVLFDLYSANRQPQALAQLSARNVVLTAPFTQPVLLHQGPPISIAEIEPILGKHGHHGAQGMAEGAIWRLERGERLLARAKYVRAAKVDGALLAENSGAETVWNWQPVMEKV